MKKKFFTSLLASSSRSKMESDLEKFRKEKEDKQVLIKQLKMRRRDAEAEAYETYIAGLAQKIARLEVQLSV